MKVTTQSGGWLATDSWLRRSFAQSVRSQQFFTLCILLKVYCTYNVLYFCRGFPVLLYHLLLNIAAASGYRAHTQILSRVDVRDKLDIPLAAWAVKPFHWASSSARQQTDAARTRCRMRPIKNGGGVHDKDTTRIVGSNGRGCLDMFLAQEDTGMGRRILAKWNECGE